MEPEVCLVYVTRATENHAHKHFLGVVDAEAPHGSTIALYAPTRALELDGWCTSKHNHDLIRGDEEICLRFRYLGEDFINLDPIETIIERLKKLLGTEAA